jgi:hypothetical protein
MSHQSSNTQFLHCRQMQAVEGATVNLRQPVLSDRSGKDRAFQPPPHEGLTGHRRSQPLTGADILCRSHVSSEAAALQVEGGFKLGERRHHHDRLGLNRGNHRSGLLIKDEQLQQAAGIYVNQIPLRFSVSALAFLADRSFSSSSATGLPSRVTTISPSTAKLRSASGHFWRMSLSIIVFIYMYNMLHTFDNGRVAASENTKFKFQIAHP